MFKPLTIDIARTNFNPSRPLIWLPQARAVLNMATSDALDGPNPYCEALLRYANVLKDYPAEMGPIATRPFLRFCELLDAKKESLFELMDAREEYDEWLAQADHVFQKLHSSAPLLEMLASVMGEHQWNPLPFLARCEEHAELLSKDTPSQTFTAPLLAAVYHAVATQGYTPAEDSPLLHGIWELCQIHDAPASTENEEEVARNIKLFIKLFPTSINGAMVHFYDQNDGNILPEMQDDIAAMDLSHASGDGLDLLLRAITEWQHEDNSAWAIVAAKHPLFAQSVDLHSSLGYATYSEGLSMLKSSWEDFRATPNPTTLALPEMDPNDHVG